MKDTLVNMTGELMRVQITRCFVISAGVILAVTGIAKLISITGISSALQVRDPIFGVAFRQLFTLVGFVEVVLAVLCFVRLSASKNTPLVVALIAGLSSSFMFYRASLWLIGWKRPCGCLGSLTDAIGLPPDTADRIAMGLLIYLLLGSYGLLMVPNASPIITSNGET